MLNKNRPIILIGGAPTTGKSTITQALAEQLHLPWISTDQIRAIMREGANPQDHPLLFEAQSYTAEEFLTKFTAEEIADKEFKEATAVWPAIKMFVETEYTWDNGFIMEGVAILPELVARNFIDNTNIKSVFLVDEDADRIRDVVFHRGLWDDADTYSDDVKEKEVEWVLQFSHRLKTEASQYGFPCVEVQKQKEDVQAVLTALGL